MDSVPAALELSVVEGRARLSFEAPDRRVAASPGQRASRAPTSTGWAGLAALQLDVPRAGPELDLGLGLGTNPEVVVPGARAHQGRPAAGAVFQNRRLALRSASITTSVPRLQAALDRCPLGNQGVLEARLCLSGGRIRVLGRFGAGGRETPFSILVAIEPRAGGSPRRLRIGLADVRVFGPLPVPGPLVGEALARAIRLQVPETAAWPDPGQPGGVFIANAGVAGTRHAGAATVELDPLELVLANSLVARGWRLPALDGSGLHELAQRDDGEFILHFGAVRPNDQSSPMGAPAAATACLEGEPLPAAFSAADELLFSGDLVGAEGAYRALLADHPEDRFAQARLLALTVATGSQEAAEISAAMLATRPSFVPALLGAAAAAITAHDFARAAALFADAAQLADERGEKEDGALARAAMVDALASASATTETMATTAAAGTSTEIATTIPSTAAPSSGPVAVGPVHEGARANGERQPSSLSVTRQTEAVYQENRGRDSRAQALAELLQGFERLTPEGQHEAYASFGQIAEAAGDLEQAEEAYWRATVVAGDPQRRSQDLAAHARVLLLRGAVQAAVSELEEALALAPSNAGAMALLAEQAFQAREWTRARQLYNSLHRAPDGAEAITRDVLLTRRAVLARAAGDPIEAEECYRELAILNPRHIEARQALARISLERHDLASAAEHLEQVLRLLPLDALESLLDVRQHLADIYVGLSDWARARTYVELVLVQDPHRLRMLEQLSEIYQRLGLHVPAVETLSRLARLHPTPRGRAEALLRQGDILGRNLDDEARAFDAYLKSSDLDPTYAPTASRLVNAYWARGQFENVAALADDLASAAPSPALSAARPAQREGDDLSLRLRLAMATALERRDPRAGISAANLSATAFDPIKAAAVLVEAAAHLSGRSPEALEPALLLLEIWRSSASPGAGAGAPESSEGPTTLDELRSILWPRLLADPSTPGLARTTGFVAERRGDTIEARVCFSIATFLDDADGAALRLGTLGPMAPPNLAALALGGPVDDPETSGPMTPMRRSLAALARALAGFQPMEMEAGPDELLAVTGSFDVGQRDRLYALAQMFATRDLILTTVSDSPLSFDETGSGSEPRGRGGGSPAEVRIVPTHPASVEIPARLNKLPEAELTFLVARGFDRLRSGMALIDLVTSSSAYDVASLLAGAEAALSGGDQPTEGLSGAVARAIANPGRLAQLLEGSVPLGAAGNQAGTAEMLADLGRARSTLEDWPTFRAAADRAANRFATIACQSVLAALRALYLLQKAPGPDAQMETERGAERNRRASFLRQPPGQELLQFVTSSSYARVLTDVLTSATANLTDASPDAAS